MVITWRTWVDLDKEEKTKNYFHDCSDAACRKALGIRLQVGSLVRSYLLCKEEEGTELHDAKEFATLLNSTARYGQYEVGLQVCLGDRGKWFKEALNLLSGHRHNLVEGLQFAREEKIQKRTHLQYFHAGDGIRDTIIGIVTNMMLNAEDVDKELPLIGFAHTRKWGCEGLCTSHTKPGGPWAWILLQLLPGCKRIKWGRWWS